MAMKKGRGGGGEQPYAISIGRAIAGLGLFLLLCLVFLYSRTEKGDEVKRSHDDYDAREEENRVYLEKVAAGQQQQQQQQLFYIYPWPEDVVNRWPRVHTHFRQAIPEVYAQNGGLGPLVDRASGRYHTHQYSLFRTFLRRLGESPLRTLDPDRASLFFVPYDLGMDASARQSDGALCRTDCPKLHEASALLRASPHFARRLGSDHFLLHSINQMMLHYATMPCLRGLYEHLCFNCTKLSLDVYPPEMYPAIKRHAFLRHAWVSVPFPSDFHFGVDTTAPLWRWGHAKDSAAERAAVTSEYGSRGGSRPVLVAYLGTEKVTAARQTELRTAIRVECRRRRTKVRGQAVDGVRDCVAAALPIHDSHALLNATQGHDVSLYARSRLCLMPGGDFPTRKGFFDALLSGCVPVIFQESSGISQWAWHWLPREDVAADASSPAEVQRAASEVASACTILVSRRAFMLDASRGLDQLVAMALDPALLAAKRRCLARVAVRMQYSAPGSLPGGAPDAVDVVLERLLSSPDEKKPRI